MTPRVHKRGRSCREGRKKCVTKQRSREGRAKFPPPPSLGEEEKPRFSKQIFQGLYYIKPGVLSIDRSRPRNFKLGAGAGRIKKKIAEDSLEKFLSPHHPNITYFCSLTSKTSLSLIPSNTSIEYWGHPPEKNPEIGKEPGRFIFFLCLPIQTLLI